MEILWEVPNSNGSPIDFYQCFMDDGQGGDLQLIYTGQHPYCRKAGLKVRCFQKIFTSSWIAVFLRAAKILALT